MSQKQNAKNVSRQLSVLEKVREAAKAAKEGGAGALDLLYGSGVDVTPMPEMVKMMVDRAVIIHFKMTDQIFLLSSNPAEDGDSWFLNALELDVNLQRMEDATGNLSPTFSIGIWRDGKGMYESRFIHPRTRAVVTEMKQSKRGFYEPRNMMFRELTTAIAKDDFDLIEIILE